MSKNIAVDQSSDRGWILITDHPDLAQKQYSITEMTTVGRDPSCDISIIEGFVSRRHVTLIPHRDYLLVKDLGSTNGTFINGEAIIEGKAHANDEIRIDKFVFTAQLIEDLMRENTQSRAHLEDVTQPMTDHTPHSGIKPLSPSIIQDRGALLSLLEDQASSDVAKAHTLPDMPCLVVVQGQDIVSSNYYLLNPKGTRIGRLPDNDIIIPQEAVSAHHALIQHQDNQWILIDQKSINGTQLNHKPITEKPLTLDDHLTIGQVTFKFQRSPSYSDSLSSIMSLTQTQNTEPSSSHFWLYTISAIVLLLVAVAVVLFLY